MKLSKRFEIRLDDDQYQRLKDKAASLGTNMSTLVRLGIDSAIKLARKEN